MCYIYWLYNKINNTQVDNAKDLSMHNLIEYSNNYSKTSSSLFWYYRGKPALFSDFIVATGITLRLWWSMIGSSNDEVIFGINYY